jgi:hypothetical protein
MAGGAGRQGQGGAEVKLGATQRGAPALGRGSMVRRAASATDNGMIVTLESVPEVAFDGVYAPAKPAHMHAIET